MQIHSQNSLIPAQRVPVQARKADCLSNRVQSVFQAGVVCAALSPVAAVIKMGALEYAPAAAIVSFIVIALLFEYEFLPS